MAYPRRLHPSMGALCAFDAVARTSSFTRAAEELSLTQSAVSRQVSALERQLDCRLFERGTRAVELTSAGRSYADQVAPALERIRNASLAAIGKAEERVATIAVLPTFGTRWLMPRLPAFLAMHPDATLSFVTRIGVFDFRSEAIDAAIHHGTGNWDGARLTLLMTETIVPVASPAFVSGNPDLTPERLRDLPRLEMKSRPDAWRDWFAARSLPTPPRVGMMFEQFTLVSQACMAGLGVALMPEFLIGPELAQGRLVRLGDGIVGRGAYYFATPAHRAASPVVEALRNWIVQEAARALQPAAVRRRRRTTTG